MSHIIEVLKRSDSQKGLREAKSLETSSLGCSDSTDKTFLLTSDSAVSLSLTRARHWIFPKCFTAT